MSSLGSAALLSVCLVVSGCVGVSEIRTHHEVRSVALSAAELADPLASCSTDNLTTASASYAQEDYGNSWASFVEFDDEGWLYNPASDPNQIGLFARRLEKEVAEADAGTRFIVIAFIHGWHHNAHDSDCNVHEFRAMVNLTAQRYASDVSRKTRVIGLYVGWRGESFDLPYLRYTSILDRRNAAERVAKGDVRTLFALLRKVESTESARFPGAGRLRTVVVGHSFGGLIAFNGLSPAILNELTIERPEPKSSAPSSAADEACRSRAEWLGLGTAGSPQTSGFPDLLVLINPAFEATRFEAIHQLSLPTPYCPSPTYRGGAPRVIVVTADNDGATGPVFNAGRKLLTLLEAYPKDDAPGHHDDEREANLHAIGFVDRYKTHRLCLQGTGDSSRVVAALQPSKSYPQKSEAYAPVWVMGAPPIIVDEHNGFFYSQLDASHRPLLLDWLIKLHVGATTGAQSAAPFVESCPDAPSNW